MITRSLFIELLLYSAVGSFGFATFGSDVQSNILANYDKKDKLFVVARCCVTVGACATAAWCPLMLTWVILLLTMLVRAALAFNSPLQGAVQQRCRHASLPRYSFVRVCF